MNIFSKNNYYFIGIGGIGISSIARMLLMKGKNISGSDNGQSNITEDLTKLGIKINIGQKPENIPENTEVVIYTIAIPENNPELMEARRRGIVCVTYPEALGELSKSMYTIAISGTHGKTTTTAMVAHILQKEKIDPTVVIGSKMINENTLEYTNFIAGKSNYLVVEACEYKKSFLNINPKILTINNIEEDHLDFYKDLDDIQNAFKEMVGKVESDGFIVTWTKDENIHPCLINTKAKTVDCSDIEINEKIGVAGKHNILNAKIAIKVCELIGVKKENAIEALKTFKGTWRRLEYKGKYKNKDIIIYDDYAHHPTAIKLTLETLKESHPDREIICVFEPHQQSRLKVLFDEFVTALSCADISYIAPIFLSRETDDGITTNKVLSEKLKDIIISMPVDNVESLEELLNKIPGSKPVCIVMMGAGNIYKWTEILIQK